MTSRNEKQKEQKPKHINKHIAITVQLNKCQKLFTPRSDQLQFSLSVSHQRYISYSGELGI